MQQLAGGTGKETVRVGGWGKALTGELSVPYVDM